MKTSKPIGMRRRTLLLGAIALAVLGFAIERWVNYESPRSAELERFADRIVEHLSLPPDRREEVDEDGLNFSTALIIHAGGWQHPKFREPLLKILENRNTKHVSFAAEALLRYKDPKLRARVEGLLGDKRGMGFLVNDGWTLGETIQIMLDESDRVELPPPYEKRPDGPLTMGRLGSIITYTGDKPELSLDDAVRALDSKRAHIRRDASVWLMNNGIALETADFVAAWPSLDNPTREKIAQLCLIQEYYVGKARARAMIEHLFARREKDQLRGIGIVRLMHALATLGSPAAREFAFDYVESQTSLPPMAEMSAAGTLRNSLHYLSWIAGPEDREKMKTWIEGDAAALRETAAAVFARIDDAESRSLVSDFLPSRKDDPFRRKPYLAPLTILGERSYPDTETRVFYARLVLEHYERRFQASLVAPKDPKERFPARNELWMIENTLRDIIWHRSSGAGRVSIGDRPTPQRFQTVKSYWSARIDEFEASAR